MHSKGSPAQARGREAVWARGSLWGSKPSQMTGLPPTKVLFPPVIPGTIPYPFALLRPSWFTLSQQRPCTCALIPLSLQISLPPHWVGIMNFSRSVAFTQPIKPHKRHWTNINTSGETEELLGSLQKSFLKIQVFKDCLIRSKEIEFSLLPPGLFFRLK